MTTPLPVSFVAEDLDSHTSSTGTLVVFTDTKGGLTPAAEHLDGLTGGALTRATGADGYKPSPGKTTTLNYASGVSADRLILASLGEDPDRDAARRAGGAIAKALASGNVTICTQGAGDVGLVAEAVFATVIRLHEFSDYKKSGSDEDKPRTITVTSGEPEALASASNDFAALAEGIFFTRDLVNEPANTLTTDEFAARLAAMGEMGLEVEILGEPELKAMGANALLGVGLGSDNETKLVVMKWMGGGDEAPRALVGKGVIFDTGGISLKPSGGMEDMTMDMGGAGVVSGVMRTLALRKAKANVVGVVGLVENMPDARAQRPGDIVKSMKGDTIEIIITDAVGRLLLADALWYTQETFKPSGIIDLATLTGAIMVALGKHYAGLFSNNDDLAAQLPAAGEATGERVWRMPLGPEYDKMIDSKFADMKNIGGRWGGSCTAAQFLKRFVGETPWAHLDIAGTAMASPANDINTSWGSGYGVRLRDQLVSDVYEG